MSWGTPASSQIIWLEDRLKKVEEEQHWNWDQINRLACSLNMLGYETNEIIDEAIRIIKERK